MVIKGDKDRCRIRDDQYGLGGHCWLSFKTTDTPVFFSFDQLLQQFSSHSNWKISFNSVQASISPFIFKSQKAALSKKITRDSENSVVELKVPYFESVSAGSHFAIHFLSPHSPSFWPLHHRAPRSTPTKIYSTGQH